MEVHKTILDVIGNTPLVQLNKVSQGLKPVILAKLENLNPGGSVIVEPTSGNTGVGLAMVASVKGYKMIFVMPDKMSEEKRAILRAYGAKVVVTPTNVPPESAEHYTKVAERLERETPNSYMPNQYENRANPEAHYRTTGPEIWRQTEGKVDVFVCSMGTGGTITGTGRFLKEKKKSLKVVGADPEGSIFYPRFHRQKEDPHQYKVEGIGEDFMPGTLDMLIVDDVIQVSDTDAFRMARRLAQEEGIMAGGSAGTAVQAALRVAERLDERKTIVTLLPDTGRNYLSKLFSDKWMREQGFPVS